MADPNAFPNKELEDLNAKIKEKVQNVLKNIDTTSINQKVKTQLEELELTSSTVETGDDETWSGKTFIPNKRYLDSAKEAGADNVLFYPSKILAHLSKNPEKFSEETIKRQTAFDLQGESIYDIAYREDDIGKKKQREYYGKTSTKIISGLAETGYDTMRSISGLIAKLVDAVGPENAKSAVEYIENNLPRADEVAYPKNYNTKTFNH